MIKLPDPAAPSRWKGDPALYSADQLKQAIRDALEEAAQKCESIARDDYGMTKWHEYAECADAIRSLKETIQ